MEKVITLISPDGDDYKAPFHILCRYSFNVKIDKLYCYSIAVTFTRRTYLSRCSLSGLCVMYSFPVSSVMLNSQ